MATASESEAKDHLASIRANVHKNLPSTVHSLLDILRNDLYDSDTQFLLELLQNADDNQYDCACPTLKFTYEPGSLRVDCNEVGFSRANVDAICAVGRSTKHGRDSSTGFTGEKSIGFKSVFKVADEVWISSREYHFKLEQKKEFGMMSPTSMGSLKNANGLALVGRN
ncbi:hypothetical protein LTR85_010945 [Meristemomyces frigidus]|nr:hypothetical protein LTR85_010945 [Meristemomyces frigidus]